MNNNQIITEELKTIVALMSYDRSKTLMEQSSNNFNNPFTPPPLPQDNTNPWYYNKILRDYGSYENYQDAKKQMEQEQIKKALELYYLKKKPAEPYMLLTGPGYLNSKGQHKFDDGEQHWVLPYLSPRLLTMIDNGEVYDVKKYKKNGKTHKYFASNKYKEVLQSIYELDYNDWNSLYGPKAKNQGVHKILGYAELILTGIGILASLIAAIPSGGASLVATAGLVSSFSLGLAVTAGLADAALYLSEGDPYSALMAGALTLIPGDELFKIMKVSGKLTGVSLPILENILKVPDDLLPIIKKARKGLDNLTDDELQAYLTFQRATILNSALIGKESLKYSFKAIKNGLKELPFGKKIFNLLDKSSGFIKAGGTAYSVDQLWLVYSMGSSLDAEKRRNLRSNIISLPDGQQVNLGSDFGTLMDYAYENGLPATIKMIGVGLWDMIWNKDGSANEKGRAEISKDLDNKIDDLPSENEADLESYEITDKDAKEYADAMKDIKSKTLKQIQSIISYKSGHGVSVKMIKNGNGKLKRGDEGNSTKYIQNLLVQIKNPDGDNYNLGTTGPDKNGVDADFGPSTEEQVINFQADYDITPSGIVDKETIDKMEEILKKQKNEEQ